MAAEPNTVCPRCGGAFRCGMHDAGACACTGVQLSAELLATLRQRHSGCLCMACLHELAPAQSARATARLGDNGQLARE